ncbi:MAG: DUF222 domain-containing protein [Actinobacteria bacterium]|nr:DUF222 domain-containing protein [Actinomycetota bacterium]
MEHVARLHDARRAALAAIAELVDAASGLPLALATDDEIAETLLDLVDIRRRTEAALGDVAARFKGTTVWSAGGFRSARDWLGAHTNEGPGLAMRPFETGLLLRHHPHMAAALRRGQITRVHVQALADAHRLYPRLAASLDSIESELVEHATHLTPQRFRSILLERLKTIDPDAVDEADAIKRRDSVGLHATALLDGFVRVDGLLDPETGQQFLNLLASARDKARQRADVASKIACTCGDGAACTSPTHAFVNGMKLNDTPADVPDEAQPRLSSHNVEAFRLILDAASAATDDFRLPDVGGERPVVHITIDSETLTGGNNSAAWLQSLTGIMVTPITAAAAQRLSCDAVKEICVIDPRGHLDAISARQRVIPAGLRRAITTRDGGRCRFPGCQASIREVHHIRFWRDGGPTSSHNLVGLCSHHHHLAHEGGWALRGDPNETLTFINPRGRIWSSDPPI